MHFDSKKAIVMETDISEYLSTGTLLKHNDNGILYLVASYSKKQSAVECNDEVYNK